MWDVNGCFVCRKYHLVRPHHNGYGIKTAIRKLKAEHQTALLTVEKLAAVYDVDEAGDEEMTDSDSVWIQ